MEAGSPPEGFPDEEVALGGFGGGTVAELPARLSILAQFSGERYKDMASGATMENRPIKQAPTNWV